MNKGQHATDNFNTYEGVEDRVAQCRIFASP